MIIPWHNLYAAFLRDMRKIIAERKRQAQEAGEVSMNESNDTGVCINVAVPDFGMVKISGMTPAEARALAAELYAAAERTEIAERKRQQGEA